MVVVLSWSLGVFVVLVFHFSDFFGGVFIVEVLLDSDARCVEL